MKIEMHLIERMVEAGASGAVILAYLREQEAKWKPKREKETKRKAAYRSGKQRDKSGTPTGQERDNVSREAILKDTPRARLFREGKGALLTLNISESRAGALIVEWLKLTRDDDQLVMATILKAQELAVAEAPSWILATLRGKVDGSRTGTGRTDSPTGPGAGQNAILTGVGRAFAKRFGDKPATGPRDVSGGADAAGRTSPDAGAACRDGGTPAQLELVASTDPGSGGGLGDKGR